MVVVGRFQQPVKKKGRIFDAWGATGKEWREDLESRVRTIFSPKCAGQEEDDGVIQARKEKDTFLCVPGIPYEIKKKSPEEDACFGNTRLESRSLPIS